VRVLCLTPWFPDRPGEREGNYIFDSVMALSAAGINVKVLVTKAWRPGRSDLDLSVFPHGMILGLIRHISIPRNYLRGLSKWLYFIACYRKLLCHAKKHQIELIHAHTEGVAEVAVAVGEALNIPVVVTIHGINMSHRYIGADKQRAYFRKVLNACDRVIIVGEPLRAFFKELVGCDDHFRVVHNGFRLTGEVPERKNILTGGNVHHISVSNLHEGKGIDITLRALAQLNSEGTTGWIYTIVGDGAERPMLEKLVTELGLDNKVKFTGAVAHDRVSGLLAQADIFVLPSYREAFGIAYLEAMACGLVAVGVEGQGAAEFIRHGVNGLLVKPKNITDLAEKLRYLQENSVQANAMAAAGAETARFDFNWEHHACALVSLYSEVISEKGANSCRY